MDEETKRADPPEAKSGMRSFWELLRFVLFALAVVIPIRVYIAQPFVVSGSSMVPTFENGDYLIVDEISYRLRPPKRNEVIVFRYPQNPKKFFIKRVIGLPGEEVKVEGQTVKIKNKENSEETVLPEPFVKNLPSANTPAKTFTLGENEYFVMGDNRSASSDSRYWGAVHKNLIMGRAYLRLLPVGNIGFLPGNYD